MIRAAAAAFALLIPFSAPALAQAPIAVGGAVAHPASVSVEQLAAMPSTQVQAVREGGAAASYSGPLLWPLLEAAGPVDGPERGAHLRHVVLARGLDGYAVALAMGEIDPRFEGKQVIVALVQDGTRLASPRLVVPGDRLAGRNVRDLVAIELQ